MQTMPSVSPLKSGSDREPSFLFESRDDSQPVQSFLEWAFQHSPAATVLLAPDLRVLLANPAAGTCLGGPPKEIHGLLFTDCVTEASGEALRAFIEQLSQRGAGQSHKPIQLRPTGKSVQLKGATSPYKNGWFVTLEEVSDRTVPAPETAVRQAPQFTPAAANEPEIVIDPETLRLVDCNETAAERFGFTRSELLSMSWSYFSLTGTAKETTALFGRILKGEKVSFMVSLRGSRGEVRIFESTGQLLVKEGKSLISWTGTDRTQLARRKNNFGERERIFSTIIGQALDGIVLVDLANGRFTAFNEAAHRGLGYTQAEFSELSIGAITQPPLHTGPANGIFPPDLAHYPLGGGVFETVHLHKDGTLRNVRVSTRKIVLGAKDYFASIWTDITERKKAENALWESENRFSHAFEHAATGQALFSLEGQWLKVNQALCEILGYGEDELLSSNIQAQSHPDDMRITEFHADRLRRGEVKSAKYRKRYIHKKGHPIWAQASVSVVRNGAGEPLYFVSQIQDITEQLRILDALTESENKERIRREELEALLEVLPAPIWISQDPLANLVQGNRAACETLGLPHGANLALSHANEAGLAATDGNRFFRNGQPVTLHQFLKSSAVVHGNDLTAPQSSDFEEWEIRRPDGSSSFLFGRSVHLLDASGRPRGSIAAAVDITERKRAEAALRESEERWKFALEGAGEGAWDWNVQTGVVLYSKRWKEMLGYDNDEVGSTLEDWSSRVHPDDLPKTLKDKQDYFNQITPVYQNEHRMRSKSGNWQWHLTRGKLISRDEMGRPLRMIGTHANISERKSLEARESSRSKIMTMIATGEPLESILLALTLDGEAQHQGSKCSVLLLDSQEKKLRIGAAPNLPDFYNRAVDGVTIGPEVGSCGTAAYFGKRVIVEDVYKDSRWFPYIELTRAAHIRACWSEPVFNSNREVLGTFAIYHDQPHSPSTAELETIAILAQFAGVAIERKRAEDRLLSNQRLLCEAELLAKSGAWVWSVDDDSWFVSEGLMSLLGSSSRDLPHGGLVRFCHPTDRPRLERLMAQLVADQSAPLEMELRILREDNGATRWLAMHGMLIAESTGKRVVYGAVQDITERKKAGKTLERRERELLRSNADLQQFAYAASHDLQEPLRMVSGFTQLLAKKYGSKLDEKAQQFIKFSVDGCARMKGLIDDLLEYSRVDSRGKTLEAVKCDTVLDQCLSNLGPALADSQLQIRRGSLPQIQANAIQMVQLFQNLLSNSLKFRNTQSPWVAISAQEKDHAWLIFVEDNGIGIAPQFRHRVFELFQRLHTRDKYPGTGMGLAICKKIVERHGGRIWLETPTSDEGIRVCIQWPKNPRRSLMRKHRKGPKAPPPRFEL